MNRHFFDKFISVNSLASILIESFGTFMVSVALTKFFDPAERGEYSNFVAYMFLFGFIGTNVHNRAVYYKNLNQYRNYTEMLLSSLIVSSIVFSSAGTLVLYFVHGYSSIYLILIYFGSMGTSLFTFIAVNLSFQNDHKYLLRFSSCVFSLQFLSVLIIVLSKDLNVALLMLLISIWIPIVFVIITSIRQKISSSYRFSMPSFEFIRNYLFPRFPSLPIYISIFDSLKIDLILCNVYLGHEATGNYVLATTFSISLQFISRYISLLHFRKTSTIIRSQISGVPWKLFFIFMLAGLVAGLFFANSMSYVFQSIFTNGYQINNLDFLLIWFGNMFYWGRRLIADLTLQLLIDKWVGLSELLGAVIFISLLIIVSPHNLFEFSRIYFISLLLPLLMMLTIVKRYSSNLRKNR